MNYGKSSFLRDNSFKYALTQVRSIRLPSPSPPRGPLFFSQQHFTYREVHFIGDVTPYFLGAGKKQFNEI